MSLSSSNKIWKVVAALGVVLGVGAMYHWSHIGQARILGGAIILALIFATCYGFGHRFRRIRALTDDVKVEVRRQKLVAELIGFVTIIGVSSSLWIVYATFDAHNTDAKWKHVMQAYDVLKKELSPSYCKSKPYREDFCNGLEADTTIAISRIIESEEDRLSEKIRSIRFHIDLLSKEQDAPTVAAAANKALSSIDGILWGASGVSYPLMLACLSIAFIAACRAASGKIAVAAYEYTEVVQFSSEASLYHVLWHAIKPSIPFIAKTRKDAA